MLDRIFLVRHGRTTANDDITVYKDIADHAVPLSELGCEQARKCGAILASYFTNIFVEPKLAPKIRLWTSPYERTRRTAEHIMHYCSEWIIDQKEHVNLCEQQFGLFDGTPDEELPEKFPVEYTHYRLCEEHEGRFWARMPLGESRFDVAVRVHQAFGTFHRDSDKHDIRNIIVVGHGAALRAFVMQWLHLTPEWFDTEPNPDNCSIRLIQNNIDRGYIFK